ncbi:hypothetical protein BJ912DRAFT_1148704 [Pholiota molesta]|nr:hypothetical protein BJ912DRAFT_1148704 [Pholiota molesta]
MRYSLSSILVAAVLVICHVNALTITSATTSPTSAHATTTASCIVLAPGATGTGNICQSSATTSPTSVATSSTGVSVSTTRTTSPTTTSRTTHVSSTASATTTKPTGCITLPAGAVGTGNICSTSTATSTSSRTTTLYHHPATVIAPLITGLTTTPIAPLLAQTTASTTGDGTGNTSDNSANVSSALAAKGGISAVLLVVATSLAALVF